MKLLNIAVALVILFFVSGCASTANVVQEQTEPIRVGWISDLTGSIAKWGQLEAAELAVEEINAAGGINGRPLVLIVEDGKCTAKKAIDAMNKLITIDKVTIVLGGHCTPESLAIAPIAEENKVLMLAGATSNPYLTTMGDYVFRMTQVSTTQAPIIVADMKQKEYKRVAIVFEQTDYARPIAEKIKEGLEASAIDVVFYEAYAPGMLDFRTTIEKIKASNPDAIYFSPQAPDPAYQFVKQLRDLRVTLPIYGNDVAGTPAAVNQGKGAFENMIVALPEFDIARPKTRAFIEAYTKKYGVQSVPFGVYTAESYDSVYLIADALRLYGEDVEKIKVYLYAVKDYNGASGPVTIDEHGDGVRAYRLRVIRDGVVNDYQ